jgi:hypothetical protein
MLEFLPFSRLMLNTHNLELNGHDAEVDQLHRGPYDEVRLERRHVDVLELASDSAPTTALADGHECEEAAQTWMDVSIFLCRRPSFKHSPIGAKMN